MRLGSGFRVIAVLALAAAGCQEKASVRASLDQDFDLPVGQTASIDSEDLGITFRRVAADSRCPEGAQCVWAGEAVVDLGIESKKSPTNLNLEVTLPGAAGQSAGTDVLGYRVSLLALEPYPRTDRPADSTAYVAKLRVSRS